MRAPAVLVRSLAVAAVFVVGSACSSSESTNPTPSADQAPPQVVANIPPPGATAVNPPPELPARDPAMPTETVDLIDLYHQGKADVVR